MIVDSSSRVLYSDLLRKALLSVPEAVVDGSNNSSYHVFYSEVKVSKFSMVQQREATKCSAAKNSEILRGTYG
jgi:hypothetical protein